MLNKATVNKYIQGDPEILCRSNKRSSLDQYKDFIIRSISEGTTQSEVAQGRLKIWEPLPVWETYDYM